MPIALALVASALIHAAALLGPGWELPGVNAAEPPPTIDAVLVKPVMRADAAPVARPAPKPPADKPRPRPAAAAEPMFTTPPAAVAPSAAPAGAPAVQPIAVPLAPSAGDTAPGSARGITPEPVVAPPVPVRISLPAKGRMRYVITRGEGGFVVGQAVHTWEQDGFTYKLQSVTETTGLAAIFKPARVVQTSQGEVTAEGLRPLEFRHERVGGVDTARFDWSRHTVAYAGREDSIAAGAQDMLSMYYQLVLLAPAGGVLDIAIATGRKLENYRFEILGEEVVTLPARERRAMRVRIRSGNDMIELWLDVGKGADMRGLPLKIRFTDRKGEIFDQVADDMNTQEIQ